jgi:glycine/D-amino acid oxidase-like deaminating enzyme
MDLLSPKPFWPIRDGLPANYPALERDVECEVAVVGGGITGALVAWHLADAGIDTVVLDRRDVAHGSTAGSTSLLQYEIDQPLHKLMRRLGDNHAIRSYRRCRDAVTAIGALVRHLQIDCGYQRKSSLWLAKDRTHLPLLEREFAARRQAGFQVEWWSRRRLAAESSLPYPAAIHSVPAAQVDSYRLAHGLLAAAARAGTRIYDRTAVTKSRTRARGIELRTAEGTRIRARHRVIATGYEADFLLPAQCTELHSTYAVVSEPVTDWSGWPAGRCLLWESSNPYLYLRATEDNRVMLGGYDEPFRDPARRDRLLNAKAGLLRRRFGQLFPKIPFAIAYAWAGTFAATADGLPFIGSHPQLPHTWLALGYGGNGITYSLLAAELIRDRILGRPNRDAELFGFNRGV